MTALTPSQVTEIFVPLSQKGQSSTFFKNNVDENVHWTITGHSPMAGVYRTRQDFVNATIELLGSDVLSEPLRIEIVNAVCGPAHEGDDDGQGGSRKMVQQVVVELKAAPGTVCQNGLTYDMTYCWVLLFDLATKKIIRVRAYLDSDLLTRAIDQNKKQ